MKTDYGDAWLKSDEIRSFPDRVLFHWSPRSRRKQILRYGLRPNMWSRDRLWKPPYVCFAEDPMWAWALSGSFYPSSGTWDLWQTWLHCLEEIEFLESSVDHRDFHEVRAHARLHKSQLIWVAEREA